MWDVVMEATQLKPVVGAGPSAAFGYEVDFLSDVVIGFCVRTGQDFARDADLFQFAAGWAAIHAKNMYFAEKASASGTGFWHETVAKFQQTGIAGKNAVKALTGMALKYLDGKPTASFNLFAVPALVESVVLHESRLWFFTNCVGNLGHVRRERAIQEMSSEEVKATKDSMSDQLLYRVESLFPRYMMPAPRVVQGSPFAPDDPYYSSVPPRWQVGLECVPGVAQAIDLFAIKTVYAAGGKPWP